MSYEIRRVANGFVVFPARDMTRDSYARADETHVFETWEKASDWLREKFSKGTPQ